MYGKKEVGNLAREQKKKREERQKAVREKQERIVTILKQNRENGVITSNIHGWDLNEKDELIRV